MQPRTAQIILAMAVPLLLLLAGCTFTAVHMPLPETQRRATPLYFGLSVTPDPEKNPIDPPERFEGFHAGTDFEVSKDELSADVPVFAICEGEVLFSGTVEGYGGLLVENCMIKGEEVTVLYGHVDPTDLPKTGAKLSKGESFAILGENRSSETDGNRKHLHLGIHRGHELDILGYVQKEEDLATYMDAEEVLPLLGVSPLTELKPFWEEEEERAMVQ